MKHVSYRQYDPRLHPAPIQKNFKASFPNRTYLKMIAHFTVTYCNDSCTRIIFFWILNRYSKSTCSLPQWKKKKQYRAAWSDVQTSLYTNNNPKRFFRISKTKSSRQKGSFGYFAVRRLDTCGKQLEPVVQYHVCYFHFLIGMHMD